MNSQRPIYEKVNIPTRKNKKLQRACFSLLILFCILTAGLGIFEFISKDRDFSDSENRVLASMPKLSFNSIIDGSFMTDFETYLTDQFPLRDAMISLKTATDRIIGKREENGVYIGEKNFLFDAQNTYNTKETNKKIKALDAFSKKYPKLNQLLAIAPNASYMYSEYLPYSIELPNQYSQLKKIYKSFESEELAKVNVTAALKKAKEDGVQLYYKTDHHWTTKAAYYVFQSIAEKWKLDTSKTEYTFLPVTNDFEGTLSSKAGVHDVTDTIEICVPSTAMPGSYVVNYESSQKKTASLFDESKLNEQNKYELFLGGNFDKVIITSKNENQSCLLIVKDSYANCMISMLTPYFSKIVVVDFRYLTESMDLIMSDNEFTHILYLYNLNTFLEDTSIVSALGE